MAFPHQPHPPPPTTHSSRHQRPISPATSTDSSSDNSQRNAIKVDPTFPPNHVYSDDANSNNPPSSSPSDSTQFLTYPPTYPPENISSRTSPPPEPPSTSYGQLPHPTAWSSFNYPPSSSRSPNPPYEYRQQQPWQHPHSPPADSQIDQLAPQLPADTHLRQSSSTAQPEPPQSPRSGPSPELESPSVTLSPIASYHPHHNYPVPSVPSNRTSTQPTRTYSFVALPGNAMKKRPRRKYDEIERLYRCSYEGCNKAYGTLNHLNAHVTMQRHGQKRTPNEFKELRKQWRRQKKQYEAEEAQELASVGGNLSSSQVASSGKTRRRRRATESALALPGVSSLGAAASSSGTGIEESLSHSHGHYPTEGAMPRRVSLVEYAERSGSVGSREGSYHEDSHSDEGAGYGVSLASTDSVGTLPGARGHASPVRVSTPTPTLPAPPLPPISTSGSHQTVSFWHHPHHSEQHHPSPISPTTTTGVSPHVSQLPGPGPPAFPSHPGHASLTHGHHRPSQYAQTYVSSLAQAHPQYPPTMLPAPHHPSLPFPHAAPAQPHTPPAAGPPSQPLHTPIVLPPAPQQPQHSLHQHQHPPTVSSTFAQQQSHAPGQTHPLSSQPDLAMPPIARLHPGSTLLTPVNPGHPHRQSGLPLNAPLASESQQSEAGHPSSEMVSSVGSSSYGSGHGHGLPSVLELGIPSRNVTSGLESDRGSFSTSGSEVGGSLQHGHQPLQQGSYDLYSREPIYPGGREAPGPEPSASYSNVPRESYAQSHQRPSDQYGGSHPRASSSYVPQRSASYSSGPSYTRVEYGVPEYNIPPPQRSQYASSMRTDTGVYGSARPEAYGDASTTALAPENRGSTSAYSGQPLPHHSHSRGAPADPYAGSRGTSGADMYGFRGPPGPPDSDYDR